MKFDFASRTVWIGLAHARPSPNNTIVEDALGAYVTVLALAYNREHFVETVASALEAYNFALLDLADDEPLEARGGRADINPEIAVLAQQAVITEEVQFHTFHSYEEPMA